MMVDLGWLPDASPAALSLPLKKTKGENDMEKLMGHDKDKGTYQVLSWAKQT